MSGFELFDARAVPADARAGTGAAAVTVTDNRVLLVNRTATEALGETEHVFLHFDRKRRAVGIGKAPAGDPRSYRATRRGNSKQVAISPTRFVRHYEIPKGNYPAAMEDGLLVFEVGEAKED